MDFFDANGNKFLLPKDQPVYWRVSGYALILKGNKLLTVIPTWNTLYELPGGGIEKKELIKDGIIRECYEETGYRIAIKDQQPFYVSEHNFYHRHDKNYYHSVIFIYRANLVNQKQNKVVINTIDGEEISQVLWENLEIFNEMNTHPNVYPAILTLRQKTL